MYIDTIHPKRNVLDKCGVGCTSDGGSTSPGFHLFSRVIRCMGHNHTIESMVSDTQEARAYYTFVAGQVVFVQPLTRRSTCRVWRCIEHAVTSLCTVIIYEARRSSQHLQLRSRVFNKNVKNEYPGSSIAGDKLVLIINLHAVQCTITASSSPHTLKPIDLRTGFNHSHAAMLSPYIRMLDTRMRMGSAYVTREKRGGASCAPGQLLPMPNDYQYRGIRIMHPGWISDLLRCELCLSSQFYTVTQGDL